MENNKFRHISEKELDGLLNEAFLNLDFESNSQNREILAIMAKQTMHQTSFFTFFNVRRLNLLFLLLTLSICLTSFYRYIDPLPNKESKKTNLVPEKRATEQKRPLVILPTTNYSVKSTREHLIENTSASTKVVDSHPAKNKFGNKKNHKNIIPAALSKITPIDNTSKLTGSDPEIKNADTVSNSIGINSLGVPQKEIQTSSPISKSPQARASKKLQPHKPATKAKVGKRPKRKLFNRGDRLIKRGRKYLKTSRH